MFLTLVFDCAFRCCLPFGELKTLLVHIPIDEETRIVYLCMRSQAFGCLDGALFGGSCGRPLSPRLDVHGQTDLP